MSYYWSCRVVLCCTLVSTFDCNTFIHPTSLWTTAAAELGICFRFNIIHHSIDDRSLHHSPSSSLSQCRRAHLSVAGPQSFNFFDLFPYSFSPKGERIKDNNSNDDVTFSSSFFLLVRRSIESFSSSSSFSSFSFFPLVASVSRVEHSTALEY